MIKHKFFIINIAKEEAWIEEYINQGYRLVSVGFGRYQFEKLEYPYFIPKVRLDYRSFYKQKDYDDYLAMFEDSGWRHIAGSIYSGSHYFEQMSPSSSDIIFSDNASKADRYKRISEMWLNLFLCFLPFLVTFSITDMINLHGLYNFKELYYTPGLWEMSGGDFWRAFLFETPFALGRGFAGFLPLTIIIFYGFFGIKALYWYHKEKQGKQNNI